MKNILNTRLIRPKSKNIIKRNKKIQEKLMEISENKLTILKGSAGVGKSSLISSYISDKGNYMWLSLDESCDDLSYFWTYIIYGLKSNIEDKNFYIDMINPLVNRDDIFELISFLINELIRTEEIFIVLDDFHYIENEFLLETIEHFITNTSDNIHLILISRRNIPIYLGNILMKGGIVDISGGDFYLTLDETKDFIKSSSNKIISDELMKEIYLSTEGWVGAIKLLLTVLHSDKNIMNLPKNNKLFIDYINNEVMNCLSKEEIDFLVKTSPLEYVDPRIYKEIDNKDGFEIIEKLIEKNMLIVTIDEENKIYKYHNLLRGYLIEIFRKYPEVIRNEIIDRITSFLVSEGNYDEGIIIALDWNMYDEALEMFKNNAHNIVSTKVINSFPIEYYRKSVDLAIIGTFLNYLNLDYERCALIVNSIGECADFGLLRCVKIFNIILDNSSIDNIEFELPEEIEEDLNILTKIIYYMLLSVISSFTGEYINGLKLIDQIQKYNQELKNSYVTLLCQYNIVSLFEEMGKLNEGEEGFKKLNESINTKNHKMCFDIFRSVGLPGIYIKQLREKEAESLLSEAQEILSNLKGKNAFSSLERSIVYNLAEVRYIQGNLEECRRLLDYLVDESKENYSYLSMISLKIRLLSSEGIIKREEFESLNAIFESNFNRSIYQGKVGLTYVIILFNLEKYQESLDELNRIIFISRKNSIGYLLVYSLLWKVIILDKMELDSERESINLLKEAIFYSRDEEILFPFYINRRYLKDLIKNFETQLLEDKDNEKFIGKLNEFLRIREESEGLTSREIEVLRELTNGLSNKEIGEKLFISISTVKTHIINIYSKLGVKNRVEAAEEGRKYKQFI